MASAKIVFQKWEHKKRYIGVDVRVTANNLDEAETIMEKVQTWMENNIDEEYNSNGIEFARCPATDINQDGTTEIWDGFIIDYEHGLMANIKKDIRADFKRMKKELGIK